MLRKESWKESWSSSSLGDERATGVREDLGLRERRCGHPVFGDAGAVVPSCVELQAIFYADKPLASSHAFLASFCFFFQAISANMSPATLGGGFLFTPTRTRRCQTQLS